MMERRNLGKAYAGPGVTVFYNPRRCIHFAACVRGLPTVFVPGERPWIQLEHASAGEVAEIVRQCPTGALHYELSEGPAESPDPQTTISPQPDGPLFIRGDVGVELGNETVRDTRVALCRCGNSSNKPFCDGTHAKIGWKSGERPDPS